MQEVSSLSSIFRFIEKLPSHSTSGIIPEPQGSYAKPARQHFQAVLRAQEPPTRSHGDAGRLDQGVSGDPLKGKGLELEEVRGCRIRLPIENPEGRTQVEQPLHLLGGADEGPPSTCGESAKATESLGL